MNRYEIPMIYYLERLGCSCQDVSVEKFLELPFRASPYHRRARMFRELV